MSEDADRICPLCAEEMDLTDLQLKPCKCGYEICVWCWNHVIDMAEKDNKEGKCPACRTPYDKERIVATAANCNRMVSRANAGRNRNSQKAKSKAVSAGRQHLTGVRVVQKNLVYIIGIPINLSDKSLLESKEYFGQYGKVLHLSIPRPSGVTAQRTSQTKTFCVYVTYDQEEEAIRCIQAVHNFVLEGKPLRACYGTAKYCRAWLRNVACSNPSCQYLHARGSQEESFTKDEAVSAYTRSRVPKIPTTNAQRRCGNMLPPPIDDFSTCVTSNRNIPESATNNAMSHVKVSNSHVEKSTTVLPATAKWGLHASSCRPPVGSPSCSQTHTKRKGEPSSSSSVNSSVTAAKQGSSRDDEDVIASSASEMNSSSGPSGPMKSGERKDCSTTVSDVSSEILPVEASDDSAWDDDIPISSNITYGSSVYSPVQAAKQASSWDDEDVITSSMPEMNSSSGPSGPMIFGNRRDCSTTVSDVLSEILQAEAFDDLTWDGDDDDIPISSNITEEKNVVHMNGVISVEPTISSAGGELISGLDASSRTTSEASSMSVISTNFSSSHSTSAIDDMNVGVFVPGNNQDRVHMNEATTVEPGRSTSVGDFHVSGLDAATRMTKYAGSDVTDSSIISDIFSLDSDPWDDSSSVNGFTKLLGEANKRDDSHLLSTSWKSSTRNQSRFAFARQETQLNQLESLRELPAKQKLFSSSHDSYGDNQQRSNFNSADRPCAVDKYPVVSSSGHAGLSRTKLSVPPGFSPKNKVPPPGFSFQRKCEQTYGQPYSENNLHTSRDSQYLVQHSGNMAGVEFIDPGKIDGGRGKMPGGARPRFPAEFTSEPDLRLRSHLPQHVSSHQSSRISDHIGGIYLPSSDAYSVPQPAPQNFSNLSALAHLSLHQPKSSLSLSNNREGLNDTEAVNKVAMLDNLRNERFRFNDYYPGTEDFKFHVPNTDPYNREFGM